MHIAVFIKRTTFHGGYGGLETQNKALCEGLAKRGYQITVFSPQNELRIDSLVENGVKYTFVPCIAKMSFFAPFNPKSWLNCSFDTFSIKHKEQRFDLVISQSSAGLGIIRHKEELFIPIISISHGTILGEYVTTLRNLRNLKSLLRLPLDSFYVLRNFFGVQRQFIHGSNLVVAVSNAVKKNLVEETFVEPSKIVVINNGVNQNAFMGLIKKENKLVNIMYGGRVVRSKGVFTLVNCMKTLSGAVLNIYGDGEDLKELQAVVQKLGLIGKVNIFGKISYREVIDKLFENDIFAFPTTRAEGFPMTIVEAMLAGLPVIANNMGGISDAIKNGETGFLIDPKNTLEFSQRLEDLVVSKQLRTKLGYNGKAKAQQEFLVEVMLDKYQKIFTTLVKKNL